MRFFLISILILLLSACSLFSETPEDAYKNGRYMESIEMITQYVEEKGEYKLDANDIERFQRLVSNVMAHYENQLLTASRTDYQARINTYQSLLTMKSRLSDRFFSQQIYFFNNKYSIIQLRQLIAEEYYLFGNSITANDSSGYYRKAELYHKGLEYYNYKDIQSLYDLNNTKYMQTAASEFYNAGLVFAEQHQYKMAAERFSKASQVYKPLGKYKDSDQLFVKYDKQYRLDEAKNYYQQAQRLAKVATFKYQYREIADLYQQAIKIYRPYGKYKDSEVLANQFQQKGIVTLYFQSDLYKDKIMNKLDGDYIRVVNRTANPDVLINITQRDYYQQRPDQRDTRAMSENVIDHVITVINEQGQPEERNVYKTLYFNQEIITSENNLTLLAKVNVSGLFSYIKHHEVTKESSQIKYRYFGQVPAKYTSYSSGNLKTKTQLMRKANDEIADMIEKDINLIVRKIANL